VTSTVREWKRRDWGEGGDEFHWWCTESPDAFISDSPVYETLRDELVELCGNGPYSLFVEHVRARNTTWLPHPALKVGRSRPK
jgi:hypothetical protein